MQYQNNGLLIVRDARTLGRRKATELFQSYMAKQLERIKLLEHAVRTTDGYSGWRADFTPDSLLPLGPWFVQQIETRPRTSDEMARIYSQAPGLLKDVNFDDWELSNNTLSFALDIGMYLGQALERAVPGLKWRLAIGNPRDINYQQPVLVGPSKQVFNPTHIVTTHAYGAARHSDDPERLKELFDIWAKLLA